MIRSGSMLETVGLREPPRQRRPMGEREVGDDPERDAARLEGPERLDRARGAAGP